MTRHFEFDLSERDEALFASQYRRARYPVSMTVLFTILGVVLGALAVIFTVYLSRRLGFYGDARLVLLALVVFTFAGTCGHALVSIARKWSLRNVNPASSRLGETVKVALDSDSICCESESFAVRTTWKRVGETLKLEAGLLLLTPHFVLPLPRRVFESLDDMDAFHRKLTLWGNTAR